MGKTAQIKAKEVKKDKKDCNATENFVTKAAIQK